MGIRLVGSPRRRLLLSAIAVLAIAVAAVVVLGRQQVQASTPATLTIYLGIAQVRPPGGGFGIGHTGDALREGDEIATGTGAKAAVNFPDGSVMRLDSDTTVTLTGLSRTSEGGYRMLVSQSAGSTWSEVKSLINGSSYGVKTPHAATAEVRGTQLRISVAGGVVTFDTFSGSVDVTSAKQTVHVATGQSTTVGADGAPPAPPAPIPAADRADSWTMFNLALGAAPPGTVASLAGSGLSTGESTAPAPVPGADGKRNLAVTVAWPGSTFCLEVDGPDGSALVRGCSSSPPLTVIAPKPPSGSTYTVIDVESQPDEQYWVVAVLTDASAPAAAPSTATPAPEPSHEVPGSSPSPSLGVDGTPTEPTPTPGTVTGTTATPTPGGSTDTSPTPTPGGSTDTSPSPSPYPGPSPTPTPAPSPSASGGPGPHPTPPPTPTPVPSSSAVPIR